jgi:hypothetical protein
LTDGTSDLSLYMTEHCLPPFRVGMPLSLSQKQPPTGSPCGRGGWLTEDVLISCGRLNS